MAKKIEKITRAELEKHIEKVSKLSPKEKDILLASLTVILGRMVDALEILMSEDKKSETISPTDIRDIENILSLGPTWLNFTYKLKKKVKKEKPKK